MTLPASLRPLTPILTRDELDEAALGHEPSYRHASGAAYRTAANAYDALRGEYDRVVAAYVAASATPAPVPVEADRSNEAYAIGYLMGGPATAADLAVFFRNVGLDASDTLDALMTLERSGEIAHRDGRYRLACDAPPNTDPARLDPADADLRLASDAFRMAGSPFAVRDSLPGRVPVPVPVAVKPLGMDGCDGCDYCLPGNERLSEDERFRAYLGHAKNVVAKWPQWKREVLGRWKEAPVAVKYDVDMTTGTFAGEALEDLYRPTCDQVRAAWDADDDDPSPAEAVIVDLAAMKYAMDAHRENSNAIG